MALQAPAETKALVRSYSRVGVPLLASDNVGPQYHCYECGESFLTSQALKSHSARRHGSRRLSREYVRDSTCPVCHKSFLNRARAMHHFDYTSCSRSEVVHGLAPMDEATQTALDAEQAQWRRECRAQGRSYL